MEWIDGWIDEVIDGVELLAIMRSANPSFGATMRRGVAVVFENCDSEKEGCFFLIKLRFYNRHHTYMMPSFCMSCFSPLCINRLILNVFVELMRWFRSFSTASSTRF